jgi:hypothetical protein
VVRCSWLSVIAERTLAGCGLKVRPPSRKPQHRSGVRLSGLCQCVQLGRSDPRQLRRWLKPWRCRINDGSATIPREGNLVCNALCQLGVRSRRAGGQGCGCMAGDRGRRGTVAGRAITRLLGPASVLRPDEVRWFLRMVASPMMRALAGRRSQPLSAITGINRKRLYAIVMGIPASSDIRERRPRRFPVKKSGARESARLRYVLSSAFHTSFRAHTPHSFEKRLELCDL